VAPSWDGREHNRSLSHRRLKVAADDAASLGLTEDGVCPLSHIGAQREATETHHSLSALRIGMNCGIASSHGLSVSTRLSLPSAFMMKMGP
jgi:hypothetical protein